MKHRIPTQSTPSTPQSSKYVVKQNIQTIVIAFLLLVIGCQHVYAETNAIKNVNTSISDTGNLIVDADGDGEDDIILSSDSTKVIASNQQVLADNQKTLSNSLSSINSSIGNTQQAGSITTQLNTMNTKLEAISSSLDGNQFDVGDMAVNFTFNAKGNATPADVLEGVTYSAGDGTSEGIINGVGTMPNRGTLNWNPSSSTTYTVPAGYYSGGTLNSENAYNAGVEAGKNDTDIKVLGTYSGNKNIDITGLENKKFYFSSVIIPSVTSVHYESHTSGNSKAYYGNTANTTLSMSISGSVLKVTGAIVTEKVWGEDTSASTKGNIVYTIIYV